MPMRFDAAVPRAVVGHDALDAHGQAGVEGHGLSQELQQLWVVSSGSSRANETRE
jgi:hypothetical protein